MHYISMFMGYTFLLKITILKSSKFKSLKLTVSIDTSLTKWQCLVSIRVFLYIICGAILCTYYKCKLWGQVWCFWKLYSYCKAYCNSTGIKNTLTIHSCNMKISGVQSIDFIVLIIFVPFKPNCVIALKFMKKFIPPTFNFWIITQPFQSVRV